MTGPRVRRVGRQARKPVVSDHAGRGRLLAQRTARLHDAGVPMPAAVYDDSADELVYDWIPGITGADLLRARLAASDAASGGAELRLLCRDILRPLAGLHAAPPEGIVLPPFDPWRRIRPRLGALAAQGSGSFAAEATRCAEAVEALTGGVLDGGKAGDAVPVHGDFHVGQVLFERGSTAVWLLDADDLALGAPESDLGNFAAHLASSEHVGATAPDNAFDAVAALAAAAHGELLQRSLAAARVDAYGAVALLRRALKLHDRGVPETRVAVILDASLSVAKRAASR